jgi:acyl-CoA dehydrogenase
MIDFTFPPEVEAIRDRVRDFVDNVVRPAEEEARAGGDPDRETWKSVITNLRREAKERGLWLPHMPPEWGGMGLTNTELAAFSTEAGRTSIGPFVMNCQAPDEGNQHTLLKFGTPEQQEKYLKPLCEGRMRSCFAMTEPEVAGSDPTLIQTRAVLDGDEWVINGHKWFISNALGARVAILMARTEDNPEIPQAANTAFLVDLPSEGWEVVRSVDTMAGKHNHCEIRITNLRVPKDAILGERGGGGKLSQARLGAGRLGHCMRWIGQTEQALDMMVDRALNRFSHGSLLSDKQGIQWMISESGIALYQCKLMVLHASYKLDSGMSYQHEISMAKYFVATTLWNVIDRAIQVHGALGYSTDSPLGDMLKQARWARFADGADEVHKMKVAKNIIKAFQEHGTTSSATGDLPL